MAARGCNPSTSEADAGGSAVQGHLGLQGELKAAVDYKPISTPLP